MTNTRKPWRWRGRYNSVRKQYPQESPAWQSFSDQDPFVSLIGSGEDDAADVSRKKYEYLADTYRP